MKSNSDEAFINSLKLTRTELEEMDEARLRQVVLIPLFKEMGFKDVEHYHGGIGEKGKDIVMWKENELGQRENTGVVAVKEPITSKADPRSGKGAAGKVAIQISQMFSSPFIDSVSGEKRDVDVCWVVTSKHVQKEAPDTILSAVAASVPKQHVAFISGEKLWALIMKHFPLAKVRQTLDEMMQIFLTLAPGCEVAFAANSKSRKLQITPEQPRPVHNSDPVRLSFCPTFPNTPNGRRARRDFEERVHFGKPITVSLSNLADLRLPPLAELLVSDAESGELHFKARPQSNVLHLSFDVMQDQGKIVRLPLVELKSIVDENNEIALSNAHQPLAWKFEIKTSTDRKSLAFSMSFRGANANAYTLSQALHFWAALSKPGLLVASLHTNGIPWFIERTPFDLSGLMYETPPTVQELRLFDALSRIQRKLAREFYLPDRDLTEDEIRDILIVSDIVIQGWSDFGRVSFQTTFDTQEAANGLLGADRQGSTAPHFGIIAPSQTYSILGCDIDAGPCFIRTGEARVSPASGDSLAKFDAGEANEFEVKVECVDGSTAKGYFPKWLNSGFPIPPEIQEWIDDTLSDTKKEES